MALLPLSEMPQWQRDEIDAAASAPECPPKHKTIRDDRGRAMAEFTSRAWYEWHIRRGVDPSKRRESIPEALREAVIKRDGMVCGLCRRPIADGDLHIDHIIPLSRGGFTIGANLQPAHALCNMRKGNKVA